MKNFEIAIESDPKGEKIHVIAFGLYSSPAEYTTLGHIVLDLTSLTYPPISHERSTHPNRHVTFALTDKKVCTQFIHQNMMKMMTINLLFDQIMPVFLKTKMISLWCNLNQELS